MPFDLERRDANLPAFSTASAGQGSPHLGDKDPRAATAEALAQMQMQQGVVRVIEEHDLDSLQMK